jgi:cytidine diphosphoramidate kinase
MIIWLIGLSGSGKTTIGTKLYEELKPQYKNLLLLDGDHLREVWGDKLGHTIEDRAKNAHRISHLCDLLDQQGIHAIACVLSIFPEWQRWNREHFSQYFEIFLDTPMRLITKRDIKGLYKAAEEGSINNVVGFDIDFPKPEASDLIIRNEQGLDAVHSLVEEIRSKLPCRESSC